MGVIWLNNEHFVAKRHYLFHLLTFTTKSKSENIQMFRLLISSQYNPQNRLYSCCGKYRISTIHTTNKTMSNINSIMQVWTHRIQPLNEWGTHSLNLQIPFYYITGMDCLSTNRGSQNRSNATEHVIITGNRAPYEGFVCSVFVCSVFVCINS